MENKNAGDYGQKGGNPQEKSTDSRADKDEIYASADEQAGNADSNRANQDRDAGNANLTTDSGGGLTLPEDRIEANLNDSRSGDVNDQNEDWDKQQNTRGAGRANEDSYPEF